MIHGNLLGGMLKLKEVLDQIDQILSNVPNLVAYRHKKQLPSLGI